MAKILIVDDEDRVLTLYSTILRKEGYEVLTVTNPKTAFELAVSEQPDLILLDVMIPVPDGGNAFAYLSGSASTKHIPVIFLTSLVEEGEVDAGKGKIGGREYISKSTPMTKVVTIVKEALARTSGKQT